MYSVFINGTEVPSMGQFKNEAAFLADLEAKATVVKRLKVKDGIYGYFVTGLNGQARLTPVMLVSRKGTVISQML